MTSATLVRLMAVKKKAISVPSKTPPSHEVRMPCHVSLRPEASRIVRSRSDPSQTRDAANESAGWDESLMRVLVNPQIRMATRTAAAPSRELRTPTRADVSLDLLVELRLAVAAGLEVAGLRVGGPGLLGLVNGTAVA